MKSALEELQAVIERLTDAENGCPWDKEQTPESLTEYLIEESHELVSAIRSGNTADVCEELGDVAFLLLFVAHLYQKRGQFSLDDALNNNRAKMVRRHPHVFGDVTFDNLDEQLKTWEKIKRAEHTDAEGKPQGLFDSLPSSLPPLTKAYRIHSKAARVGFTWPEDEEVEQQVEAEWLEWLDASAGDDAEAQRVHDKLNALLNHIRQNVEMIIHYEKEILRRRGFITSAYCRHPGYVADPVADRLFDELYRMIETEFVK